MFWKKIKFPLRKKFFNFSTDENTTKIAFTILAVGTISAIIVPVILPDLHPWGLATPNEIGDAIGGITNPIIGLIGVLLTFLAFYIQYKANERQVGDLANQKKRLEYQYFQESLNAIKSEIRSLSYTKNSVTYYYSEAIWNFMLDALNNQDKPQTEDTLEPLYFQMAYVLTLFEPLIHEINASDLGKKEKYQLFSNTEGLFTSSLGFILRVNDIAAKQKRDRHFHRYVRQFIIIPAKKIKIDLRDVMELHKEADKDIFTQQVQKIKGHQYIKTARYVNGRGIINFFENYQEYLESNPQELVSKEIYDRYFSKEEQIDKMLVNEPIRLLARLDFLERITMNILFDGKKYTIDVERERAENYLGMDLAELRVDKNMWRDEFVGKYVYDRNARNAFINEFGKVSG